MVEIPISFDYKGKHYKGHFSEMTGCTLWHLIIDKYFNGQLVYSKNFGFKFYSNSGEFMELSELFGEFIISWYQ